MIFGNHIRFHSEWREPRKSDLTQFKRKIKDFNMKLEVIRYSSQKDSTLGMLFDVTKGRKFLCFTLEDEKRRTKVKGETRIPAGTYKLKLRKEGGYHGRYVKKYGSLGIKV